MTRFDGYCSLTLILTLLAIAPALRAQQRASDTGQLDKFAGVWVETHPHSGPSMWLKVVPSGDRMEIWLSYRDAFPGQPETATIENDHLTWSKGQSCAAQFQSRGYDYTNPGVSTIRVRAAEVTVKKSRQPALLYVQEVKWNAPCGGHRVGTERIEKTLLRR